MWHVKNLVIGAPNNWCRVVLEWNLAADPNQGPHTDGGCGTCLGAVTVFPNSTITRNPSYYIAAAAKFVRPGSVRVASTPPSNLLSVAFLNGNMNVAIVLNEGNSAQTFNFRFQGSQAVATLPAMSVGTFYW